MIWTCELCITEIKCHQKNVLYKRQLYIVCVALKPGCTLYWSAWQWYMLLYPSVSTMKLFAAHPTGSWLYPVKFVDLWYTRKIIEHSQHPASYKYARHKHIFEQVYGFSFLVQDLQQDMWSTCVVNYKTGVMQPQFFRNSLNQRELYIIHLLPHKVNLLRYTITILWL